MTDSESYYHIGLGKSFLRRAGIIFFLLSFLFLASLTTVVYASVQNGTLNKYITQPWKEFMASLKKNWIESNQTPAIVDYQKTGTNEAALDTKAITPTAAYQPDVYYTYPTIIYPTSSIKSYEERVKEMDAQAAQRWAEQQNWFNEQKAQSEKNYQEQVLKNQTEAKQSYDEWVKQQQAENEKWKQEHGF